MGEQHLKAWHTLGVPICGVYARDMDRGRAAAAPYGCPVYDSVEALLSKANIADNCLPTTLHKATVLLAAQAGCQIVCEKPLSLNYDEAATIYRDCDAAGVRLFIAMVVRFFPVYRAVWDKVRGGDLGAAVKEIALKRVGSPPPPIGSWFLDDRLSGGVLCDLLIHDIDYAMWMAGDVARVNASRDGSGQYQYGHIELEHVGGAVSRIEGGWVASPAGLQTSIDVKGSGGEIQIVPGGPIPFSNLSDEDPYVAQLRHFVDSLANQTPFLVTREEVLRVMRVVTAVRQSATHVRPVALAAE